MARRAYRMAISEFRKTFMGKPPCANSLKKWIECGSLPGEKVGTLYYVLVDQNGDLIKNTATNDASNELFQKILQDSSSRNPQ